jgi:hypothetical protein
LPYAKSAAELPSVTVAGSSASGNTLTYAYGADVRLTAEASPAKCRPTSNLVYEWKVRSGGPGLAKPLVTTDSYFLYMPKVGHPIVQLEPGLTPLGVRA